MSKDPNTMTFQVREATTVVLEAPKTVAPGKSQPKPEPAPEAAQGLPEAINKEED